MKTIQIFASMSIKAIKQILIERYHMQMRGLNRGVKIRPLYIEGHSGVGKTQIIQQAASEIGRQLGEPVACQILNLQFCERPDFMGLPMISPRGETVFARPAILPKEGKGLLFLDEANRVDSEIRSGLLTLLEDRNINGHQLGDNWMIVLAGNPPEGAGDNGDSGTYEVGEFDIALSDRMARVQVVPVLDEIEKYFRGKYPKHLLLELFEMAPEIIDLDGGPLSPRTFEYALAATLDLPSIEDPLFIQNLELEWGTAKALQALNLLRAGYVPQLKHIINRDPRAYHFISNNPHRQDIIIRLIEQIYNFILARSEQKSPPSVDEVGPIVEFLLMMQHEHRLALFEKFRGSTASNFFSNYFLKPTKLSEVLYARRAANS